MKQFKIRASALSQIMTNGRDKKSMGQTAKTYCEQWIKEQLYDRKKEVYSKYLDKGLSAEEHAIQFIAEELNLGLVMKNEQHYENEYMTGTPDIVLSDTVIDVKCSWDCFTFPLFENDPDKQYWWQLQAYMILTDRPQAKLIYALMDMPGHLLEKEMYYAAKALDMIELEPEQEDEIRLKHTYSHLPAKLRLKSFVIERDENAAQQIVDRVHQCRDYIGGLE